jgi:predicted CXXCH cytochrome family protein
MWTPSSTDEPMTCTGCHRVISNETSETAGLLSGGGTGMLGVGGISEGNGVCYTCHGDGSGLKYGDLRAFELSAHFQVGDPPSGSRVKCVTCHENHASRNTRMTRYEGHMVCMQCHSGAEDHGSAVDTLTAWDSLTANSDSDSHHPLFPSDHTTGARMTCQNCHNTHAVTASRPLVDPRNAGPGGAWEEVPSGGTSGYCLTCHNGQPLPSNAETGQHAGPVTGRGGSTTLADIETAYDFDVHGSADASDPARATAYLRPDTGFSAGASLDCAVCHDPHGTANNFTLRTTVVSASGSMSVSGLAVYKIPEGSITPTSPVGYDTRYFCSACHLFDPSTHDPLAGQDVDTRVLGATDCTSCHRHTAHTTP